MYCKCLQITLCVLQVHIYIVQEVKMVMVLQFAYPAAEPAWESYCMCVGSGVDEYRHESRDSARAAVCELATFAVI